MNTGRRFRDEDQNIPGPGTYAQKGNIADGPQVCSNFHSTITKNLSTSEKRHEWGGNPRFRTPGPGTYRPPSDFGYLDFKNQLRDMEGSINTGFDTSIMEPSSGLKIRKIDSNAISIQSDRQYRPNVSPAV